MVFREIEGFGGRESASGYERGKRPAMARLETTSNGHARTCTCYQSGSPWEC